MEIRALPIQRHNRNPRGRTMTHPETSLPSKSPPTVSAPESGATAPALGLLPVCVLVLLWGYVVYRLGTLWHSNENYAFGWFVPLLCLALFWERWKRQARPQSRPVPRRHVLHVRIIRIRPAARRPFPGDHTQLAFCGMALCRRGGRDHVHHSLLPGRARLEPLFRVPGDFFPHRRALADAVGSSAD